MFSADWIFSYTFIADCALSPCDWEMNCGCPVCASAMAIPGFTFIFITGPRGPTLDEEAEGGWARTKPCPLSVDVGRDSRGFLRCFSFSCRELRFFRSGVSYFGAAWANESSNACMLGQLVVKHIHVLIHISRGLKCMLTFIVTWLVVSAKQLSRYQK